MPVEQQKRPLCVGLYLYVQVVPHARVLDYSEKMNEVVVVVFFFFLLFVLLKGGIPIT